MSARLRPNSSILLTNLHFKKSLSFMCLAVGGWVAAVMCAAAPFTLTLPGNLFSRLILNIPLQLQVSKTPKKIEER